jgi:hypothetical protein
MLAILKRNETTELADLDSPKSLFNMKDTFHSHHNYQCNTFLSLSLPLSLLSCLYLSRTLANANLSLSLSHTHTHTHTLSRSHSISFTDTLFLSCSLILFHWSPFCLRHRLPQVTASLPRMPSFVVCLS